ncbi:hypothetical protein D1007_39065 [Hordeum vulgare]|nr:hypothetical protein D1007_39065 [Hordeum vulgare]
MATPHITFGAVSRQLSPPGSPGADFQIAKINGTSPMQQGAAADPAEIHGVLNYENQFSVESLDSGPISTLINDPAEWYLLLLLMMMTVVGDSRRQLLMEEDGNLKRPQKRLLLSLLRIKSPW